MNNIYSSLFSEKMNSAELRTTLFAAGRNLSTSEKRVLLDAYKPVASSVHKKEMEEAYKYGMMTSW